MRGYLSAGEHRRKNGYRKENFRHGFMPI
jgi:hypothetical protein